MSEEIVSPESIGAEVSASGAEGATAENTSQAWYAADETPTEGLTLGAEATTNPAPVPYDTFRGVQTERTQFKQELDNYRPFDPVLNYLRETGLTHEQALARLQGQSVPNYGQPPVTADPWAQYLESRGIDPEYQDPGVLAALKDQWDAQQAIQQQLSAFTEFQQQQQRQVLQAEIKGELAQVQKVFPQLERPGLQELVLTRYAMQADRDPNATMHGAAQSVMTEIGAIVREEVTKALAGKQQDRVVPNVQGGHAASPVDRPNYGEMSSADRKAALQERNRTALAG